MNLDQRKRQEQADLLRNFTWGRPYDSWTIGPYFVIAYYPRISHKVDTSRLEYHAYIMRSETGIPGDDAYSKESSLYRNTNQSHQTLDAALACVIAFHHEGVNHHADRYFIRSLEAPVLQEKLEKASSELEARCESDAEQSI
jgi:hypothetical protein